jgi:hypothetical protein
MILGRRIKEKQLILVSLSFLFSLPFLTAAYFLNSTNSWIICLFYLTFVGTFNFIYSSIYQIRIENGLISIMNLYGKKVIPTSDFKSIDVCYSFLFGSPPYFKFNTKKRGSFKFLDASFKAFFSGFISNNSFTQNLEKEVLNCIKAQEVPSLNNNQNLPKVMKEVENNILKNILNVIDRISDTNFQIQHWHFARVDGKYNSVLLNCLDAIQMLEDMGLLDIEEQEENLFSRRMSQRTYKLITEFSSLINDFRNFDLDTFEMLKDQNWKRIIELAQIIKPLLQNELGLHEDDYLL